MRHDFDTALDHCLALLRRGESIDSCLARYPEYAHRLRPLLEMAVQVGRVVSPFPSEAARAAGEQRMVAALARKREREMGATPTLRSVRRFVRSLALAGGQGSRPAWSMVSLGLVILLLAIGVASVAASANSLPGDMLYAVKLASRSVQLSLTFDSQRHQQLVDRFQSQQRNDVQQVLKGGRQASVEFEGVLESMEGSLWMVGGLPVAINATTAVTGLPAVGRLVRVRGQLSGEGSVLANEIDMGPALTPEPTETPMPTETPAPTRTHQPTDTPKPSDTPRPSETPEPTGTPERIEPASPSATSEPTETPTLTETPEPTESGERPAQVPNVTDTPHPTETPEPTATPHPTSTHEPTDTPQPTETPYPTRAHEPTETPHPTETLRPTDTPHPTSTHEPTDTPHPTETPHPTKTSEGDDD